MEEWSESNEPKMELDPLQESDEEEYYTYTWTRPGVKLLIQLYQERRYKFRDPHFRKKNLYMEMAREMRKAGYHGLTCDSLDRKMRNMKKSYRNIKEGKRKRASWEYFQIFEKLFGEEWEQSSNKTATQGDAQNVGKIPLKREQRGSKVSYSEDTMASDATDMSGSPVSHANHVDPLNSSQWSTGAHVENVYPKCNENDVQRRTEAIEKLAQRLDEANQIQIERNALLKQFLSKFK